jgi:hypothetical protein
VAEKIDNIGKPLIRVVLWPCFRCHRHYPGVGEVFGYPCRRFSRFQPGEVIGHGMLRAGSVDYIELILL